MTGNMFPQKQTSKGGMAFDGKVGVLGSLPPTPATYDILISCRGEEDGFLERCRGKVERDSVIINDGISKNQAGCLEYRAKVRKVAGGQVKVAEPVNTCMLG